MPYHVFIQVKKDAENWDKFEYKKYIQYIRPTEHKDENVGKVFVLNDDYVFFDMGRIDNQQYDPNDTAQFKATDMKFYSGFIAYEDSGEKRIGLNYYGITILREDTLKYIAELYRGLTKIEKLSIKGKFIRFCREAYENGFYLVHYGI